VQLGFYTSKHVSTKIFSLGNTFQKRIEASKGTIQGG
jgi:hypothetical protein